LIWELANFQRVGGQTMSSFGFANLALSPLNMSYSLPNDFYVKFGLSFQLPIGDIIRQGHHLVPVSLANNTWTFEPDLGISWLHDGWNLSAHNVIDFQTRDEATNYQSGDVFYLDLTATKTFGNWTAGLGGNVSQQFTDDYQDGVKVNGNGNRWFHLLMGPIASYDGFSPVSIKFLGLIGLRAKNDINYTEFRIQVVRPL